MRTVRIAPGSRERPIFSIGWNGWISRLKRPKPDATDLRHWYRLKQMDAFLPPSEKPQGLIMKFVYAMTRRHFGKVITPLNMHSARLPLAFGQFYTKIPKLDQKLLLLPETALLLREQVARINLCLFCIDGNRWAAIKESMHEAKFDALEQYSTSPLFTDVERVALDYVTELTKNKKVTPQTLARMPGYYSAREICEIIWLVASEHLYNLTNIGQNIHSHMLCDSSSMSIKKET
jgi:alkylhydroperoxidase family enzyme